MNQKTGAGPIRGGRAIDGTQYVLEYCVGRCACVDLLQWCVLRGGPRARLMVGNLERDVSRARVEHWGMGKSGPGALAWRAILAFGTPR